MAKGRRNKNNADGGSPGKSPNNRDRKRGKHGENDPLDDTLDEEMTPKELFGEDTSSDSTTEQNNTNTNNDDQLSNDKPEQPELTINTNNNTNAEAKKSDQATVTETNNNNNSTTANSFQKLDLAIPAPPTMWKIPIRPPTTAWLKLDKTTWKDLHPYITQELLDVDGDLDGTSLEAKLALGHNLITGGTQKDKNPSIANWQQVINDAFTNLSPVFVDYGMIRVVALRLALTDPVTLFTTKHWFNEALTQVLDVHNFWIATYLTFGAPWKNREFWFRPKTPTKSIDNPYNKKKSVAFNDRNSATDVNAIPSDLPIPTSTPANYNAMFLRKPLKENQIKKQVIQKTKDYTRNYRTYVKIRLSQVTSELYAEQEAEISASFRQIMNHLWTIDNSVIVLPWKREEAFTPIRKGHDFPRTKTDIEKYVDRLWMEKHKSAYCRLLLAHNKNRTTLLDDSQLQNWLTTSQLMLQVERIQAHSLSKAGHLLGYHSTVCNCSNLADAIQQHPLMSGFSVEVRSEFITFNAARRPAKESERTKTKILQVYVASDSAGKARRALTQIFSSQAKGQYPLGVHARFIPNVNDLRFARPTQVSLAYTNSLKKHIEFMKHTMTFSTENIIELDAVIDRYGFSLREIIMHIFSGSKPTWNLFLAVDTSFYGDCVHFAFREELQEEAMNMISALPLFLEAYLGHSDVWKWFTRRARDEADDYEWSLEKGLVPKGEYYMDTQLENWEHLDEIDDADDNSNPIILQPFTLDMQAFGVQNYTDDGTIQTRALLAASKKSKTDNAITVDDDDDTMSNGTPSSATSWKPHAINSVSTTATTTSQTTSTLTATPSQLIFAEFEDEPELQALIAKLQAKKLSQSPAAKPAASGDDE